MCCVTVLNVWETVAGNIRAVHVLAHWTHNSHYVIVRKIETTRQLVASRKMMLDRRWARKHDNFLHPVQAPGSIISGSCRGNWHTCSDYSITSTCMLHLIAPQTLVTSPWCTHYDAATTTTTTVTKTCFRLSHRHYSSFQSVVGTQVSLWYQTIYRYWWRTHVFLR
jgi:hypothetical protein